MDPIRPEDYLAHYGVKGQKWGVRRKSSKSAKSKTKSKTPHVDNLLQVYGKAEARQIVVHEATKLLVRGIVLATK